MPVGSRISNGLFNGLVRKNATYLTVIFLGAFAFELGFEGATNSLWDGWNRGRQWKDIKHRYMHENEDEE
ncbi:qcr9 subunit 9 of the ubiquinol cytochrome-c reductase complex [Cladophialophora chaetospira]|uniref:Complex III subunit 9 n=1 Tax=Cladophialophora chaetospira TaxID=386627 RepID=A0AA39CMZ2_9EURO|nr:qcr9 subunit 9 of the ubiquinol cytochrome-c reductase complex [Cladophialophora chaetospira]